jgi:hypothetical protein
MNAPRQTDARIPLLFAAEAAPADAQLLEGRGAAGPNIEWFTVDPAQPPSPGHAAGCTCCTPRGSAGLALARLALARARGEAPFFHRLIARTTSAEGRAAVLRALSTDPVAAARYRLAE